MKARDYRGTNSICRQESTIFFEEVYIIADDNLFSLVMFLFILLTRFRSGRGGGNIILITFYKQLDCF